MAERALRLVELRPSGSSRGAAAVTAGAAVGLAILATLLGADEARKTSVPRAVADRAVRLALEHGPDDPRVRAELVSLRSALGDRPLDSLTRVAYAAALAGIATSTKELDAAAFHAESAARLAKVTVPVVRNAVLVLVRAGKIDRALELVAAMFGFDPGRAARLLLEIEPFVPAGRTAEALVPTAQAWLAWSSTLGRAGRTADARAALDLARTRWPEDLDLLALAASSAYSAGDLDALAAIVPPDLALPQDRRAAMLLVYRAILAGRAGDRSRARSEIDRALALDPRNGWLRILAGDALDRLGDTESAVRLWSRVRHETLASDVSTRVAVLKRLARVDEREARAGAALRLWREVLVLVPEDREATRRVAALTGASD